MASCLADDYLPKVIHVLLYLSRENLVDSDNVTTITNKGMNRLFTTIFGNKSPNHYLIWCYLKVTVHQLFSREV